jgi:integrase
MTTFATSAHWPRFSVGLPTQRRQKICGAFRLRQAQIGVRPPSINSAVAALRFFFTVTLDRLDLARRSPSCRSRGGYRRCSASRRWLLLRATSAPKYKAALATAYGAGLRVLEVVALKVGDVDPERMLLHVERGKGRKDRHAMLSPQLLELLRAWRPARQHEPDPRRRCGRLLAAFISCSTLADH